jgi:hypothetical protein
MSREIQILKTSLVVSVLVFATILFTETTSADRFQSTNYTIDASAVGNSISGPQSSTSYQLTSSGGESVIGNGTSGSYKMTQGYVAQLAQSIELSISPSTLNIGTVVPNTSNILNFTATVITDAPGYTLSVNQDGNLSRSGGGGTIAGVSANIASPVTWSEGTTKGLGFTMVSTNATALPAKWNAGASYAAFPGTATAFYTRTGLSGGATDTHNMRLRLDVTTSQVTGSYSNNVTWLGTMTP